MEQPPDAPELKTTLPKLDSEAVQTAFFEAIKRGEDVKMACAAARLKVDTVHRWLNRGREQIRKSVRGKYRAFVESYELATMEPVQKAIERAKTNREKDPWLNEKFLEKAAAIGMAPEIFAPVDVQRALQLDRQRFVNAFNAEFANEPQTLHRFWGAFVRSIRSGADFSARGATSVAAVAGPARDAPRLPVAAVPELRDAGAPEAVDGRVGEDLERGEPSGGLLEPTTRRQD